jgi:MFS transporter, ACS family, D-galactonate transporter
MTDRKTEPGAWRIVALLFFFMLINFADKAIIGLAAVPIMDEMKLSPSEFGLVGSAFFLLFAISSVVVGFIANRVQSRWILLVMGLIWALSQFPMVGSVGIGTLVACRIILGAGEGPAYPIALHAAYKWFPNEQRTLPTAIIAQGAGVGIMVALPLLNLLIVHYSWHWAFGALGIAGLLWTLAWALWGREGSLTQITSVAQPAENRVPYRRLLLNPTIIASWCAYFGAYWALSLSLSWQAAYFVKGLGFAQRSVGLLTALTSGLGVVVVIGLGWYSQRLMTRGISSRVARGCLGGACVAFGGLLLIALPHIDNIPGKVAAGACGMAFPSIIYVISHAVISEITPVSQRGALLAISNAIGTTAGLIAPYVMGSLVEKAATPLDGFNGGFVICGIIMLAGGLIGMMFIRPELEAQRIGHTGTAALAGGAT